MVYVRTEILARALISCWVRISTRRENKLISFASYIDEAQDNLLVDALSKPCQCPTELIEVQLHLQMQFWG